MYFFVIEKMLRTSHRMKTHAASSGINNEAHFLCKGKVTADFQKIVQRESISIQNFKIKVSTFWMSEKARILAGGQCQPSR